MKKLRLLKFDIIHPTEYLKEKQAEWNDIDELSLEEYRNRLINLRSNYSDFYTYHLNKSEEWEAEEFFLLDPVFQKKVAEKLFGKNHYLLKRRKGFAGIRNRFSAKKWRYFLLDAYIKDFNPDVIFVRSQPIASQFWQRYRKNALLVSRLSARLPKNWHPNDWDLIYTDQPDFKTFFELHGVKTIINNQGFDKRVISELNENELKNEIIFVGGLGTENFLQRTIFINNIAGKLPDFKWWGYWWEYGGDGRQLEDFPALKKSFKGVTSGLEMLQVYKDSFAVVNDYVDTANGIGFNQRMFEVMGAGGFMFTRLAPNLKDDFPENAFVTYRDEKELLDKINYYRNRQEQRKAITRNAQNFILKKYEYQEIVKHFESDLKDTLNHKKMIRK